MRLIDLLNTLPCDKICLLYIWEFISDNDCTGKSYVYNPRKALRIPCHLLNRSIIELMPKHNTLHITLDKEGVQE